MVINFHISLIEKKSFKCDKCFCFQRPPVNAERLARARWENEQAQNVIQETTKPCPKCKVPIEKNGLFLFFQINHHCVIYPYRSSSRI